MYHRGWGGWGPSTLLPVHHYDTLTRPSAVQANSPVTGPCALPSSPGERMGGIVGGYAGSLPMRHPLPIAYQLFVLVCPSLRMSSTVLEQFSAAAAQAVQQVEALPQRLALCRRAFREGLSEAMRC